MEFLDYNIKFDLLNKYGAANRRLILLDYDGTLVPFYPNPSEAVPGQHLIETLERLNTVKNDLCLVSGRAHQWFDKWFAGLNISIIAEHGAYYKTEKDWLKEPNADTSWKEGAKEIMQLFVLTAEHTFIEEKEFSIVWHYRKAGNNQIKKQAEKLYEHLSHFALNKKLQVSRGNKIIEIKHSGINKGNAIGKLFNKDNYDFILSIGDDYTDEDMFRALSGTANTYTIKVGIDNSFARFNVYTPQMVMSLLEAISYIP
ncbi:trehalose-phosphatase [Longitalea arenae]|uniref:trehalose-phosphatase n=1 Tax=Longitalea arenae TaxID=2812558 RepID=UPI0019672855